MNNLRTFETEEKYTSFKDSDNAIYPHVCYAKDTDKVFLKKEGIKEITFYINLYDTTKNNNPENILEMGCAIC